MAAQKFYPKTDLNGTLATLFSWQSDIAVLSRGSSRRSGQARYPLGFAAPRGSGRAPLEHAPRGSERQGGRNEDVGISRILQGALPAIARPFPSYKNPGGGGSPITSVDTALTRFADFVNIFQVVFWILTAAFGIYAAYLYLTSSGDPEKLKTAGKTLIYTAVAAALAMIAYGIPAIVYTFLNR